MKLKCNEKIFHMHNLCFLYPIALSKAKFVYNFGLSECNRVKVKVSIRGDRSALMVFQGICYCNSSLILFIQLLPFCYFNVDLIKFMIFHRELFL